MVSANKKNKNMIAEYKQWLFVEVPEGSVAQELTYDGYKIVFWFDGYFEEKELPCKTSLLGLSKDLTEEQLERIVEYDERGDNLDANNIYKNYWDGNFNYSTATESGHSLLIHLGFKPEQNILILKREN